MRTRARAVAVRRRRSFCAATIVVMARDIGRVAGPVKIAAASAKFGARELFRSAAGFLLELTV